MILVCVCVQIWSSWDSFWGPLGPVGLHLRLLEKGVISPYFLNLPRSGGRAGELAGPLEDCCSSDLAPPGLLTLFSDMAFFFFLTSTVSWLLILWMCWFVGKRNARSFHSFLLYVSGKIFCAGSNKN